MSFDPSTGEIKYQVWHERFDGPPGYIEVGELQWALGCLYGDEILMAALDRMVFLDTAIGHAAKQNNREVLQFGLIQDLNRESGLI